MLVNSLRLGSLEVPGDKIVTMEKPILGFEHLKRFCLVEVDEIQPLLWLHSVEDPAVAFLAVNPLVFCPDYRIEVNSKEIAELEIENVSAVETYVIVTMPDNPADMSINLQGPILINTENNRGKQLVLVNSNYQVRHRILDTARMQQTDESSRERELVGV